MAHERVYNIRSRVERVAERSLSASDAQGREPLTDMFDAVTRYSRAIFDAVTIKALRYLC